MHNKASGVDEPTPVLNYQSEGKPPRRFSKMIDMAGYASTALAGLGLLALVGAEVAIFHLDHVEAGSLAVVCWTSLCVAILLGLVSVRTLCGRIGAAVALSGGFVFVVRVLIMH